MSGIVCLLSREEKGLDSFGQVLLPTVPRVDDVVWFKESNATAMQYVVKRVEHVAIVPNTVGHVLLRVKAPPTSMVDAMIAVSDREKGERRKG